MSNTADWFKIDEGMMYFIANTTETKRFQMYHPHDALRYSAKPIVIADEDEAMFQSFRAEFDEYLLSDVYFDREKRLWDFAITVDGAEIDTEGEFVNNEIFARYRREAEVNHTTLVFAKNSRLYNNIRPGDYRDHNVTISFSAYNYTNYYMDPSRKGELSYHITDRCKYYETNMLDLYGDGSGMALIFDKNVTLRLCTNETNVNVEAGFDVEDDDYLLLFHEGDYRAVQGYPLTPRVGTVETLTTISRDRMLYYNNRDYNQLKEEFGFPSGRDFNVTFTGEDIQASYGITQPEAQDVYAKKKKGFILDKDYEQRQVNITITVW
ncbi:TPA: hypothetical protein HA265_02510 [Candidatus Woesearchaeota archaeon]|nr:hypothetical protein [Candidatus Woesearchaeota archaeon]